jgi:hypothetical protein
VCLPVDARQAQIETKVSTTQLTTSQLVTQIITTTSSCLVVSAAHHIDVLNVSNTAADRFVNLIVRFAGKLIS